MIVVIKQNLDDWCYVRPAIVFLWFPLKHSRSTVDGHSSRAFEQFIAYSHDGDIDVFGFELNFEKLMFFH